MLDEKITMEGMFTVVMHSLIVDKQHKFLTQNDGIHIAKSPLGMFDSELIGNNLQYVKQCMAEYLGEVEAPSDEDKIDQILATAINAINDACDIASLNRCTNEAKKRLIAISDHDAALKKLKSKYEGKAKALYQPNKALNGISKLLYAAH